MKKNWYESGTVCDKTNERVNLSSLWTEIYFYAWNNVYITWNIIIFLWLYPFRGIQTGQSMNIITAAVFYSFNKQGNTGKVLCWTHGFVFANANHACLPAEGESCVGLGVFLICIFISFEFLHQGKSLHASVPFLVSNDTFVELPCRAIYYSTLKQTWVFKTSSDFTVKSNKDFSYIS